MQGSGRVTLFAYLAIVATLTTVVLVTSAARADESSGRVVKIVAQKFQYTPAEIVLKKGEPVILEFTSLDFTHGFQIPDMDIRTDIPPNKITRVALTPQKVGSFDFLCDNFCGSGHEDMAGRIRVEE